MQTELNELFATESDSIIDLAKKFGFDPYTDFRFMDLRNTDFSGEDLRGIDFSGADLTNANFVNSIHDHTTIWDGANLTDASFGDEYKQRSADENMKSKFWVANKHLLRNYREAELLLLRKDFPDDPRVHAAYTNYALDFPTSSISEARLKELSSESIEYRNIWINRLKSQPSNGQTLDYPLSWNDATNEAIRVVFQKQVLEEHDFEYFKDFLKFGASIENLSVMFEMFRNDPNFYETFIKLTPFLVANAASGKAKETLFSIGRALLGKNAVSASEVAYYLIEKIGLSPSEVGPILREFSFVELGEDKTEMTFGAKRVAEAEASYFKRSELTKEDLQRLKTTIVKRMENLETHSATADMFRLLISQNKFARRLVTWNMCKSYVDAYGKQKITIEALRSNYGGLHQRVEDDPSSKGILPFSDYVKRIKQFSDETILFAE